MNSDQRKPEVFDQAMLGSLKIFIMLILIIETDLLNILQFFN